MPLVTFVDNWKQIFLHSSEHLLLSLRTNPRKCGKQVVNSTNQKILFGYDILPSTLCASGTENSTDVEDKQPAVFRKESCTYKLTVPHIYRCPPTSVCTNRSNIENQATIPT